MTITAVYTDGGCLGASRSSVGGSWAWVGVDACGQVVTEASGIIRAGEHGLETVTSNLTEFYAMLSALEAMPDGWSGQVCADSGVTIGRWFFAWKLTNVPQDWRIRMGACLARMGNLTPVQHDGHPTREMLAADPPRGKRGNPVSVHNVRADKLCGLALRQLAEEALADGASEVVLDAMASDQVVTLATPEWREKLKGLPSVEFEVNLAHLEPRP